MIQPQELRIGSLANWGVKLATVKGIHTDTVLHNKQPHLYVDIEGLENLPYYCVTLSDLTPIPITPEILERCGFSQFKTSVWRNGRLQWVGSLVYLKNEDTDECYYIPTIVDYLHQLQNLYYSLTNQELTFKTTNNE